MVDAVDTAPPEAGPEVGYVRDFHAWTQAQAAALRAAAQTGANFPVDWENVAEEIESFGRSEASALRSRLRTIIEHLLKLEVSPARDPVPGWRETITRCRIDIENDLADSPSLRRHVPEWLEREHRAAARLVSMNLRGHGEWSPEVEERLQVRRFAENDVLGDWFPAD